MIRALLAAVLVFTVVPPAARADVYTWTDAKGVVNVSNLTPPDGVQAEKIVRETPHANVPAPVVSSPMAESAAQAEVQFLAQRVRQLEYEVDFARRQPPAPPMDYAFYPPPPSPAMQYTVDTAPQQQAYGCDPSWFGCSGWGLGGYPVGVVVLNAPNFHRPFPGRGFHRMPMQLPVRARGDPRRR